MVNAGIAGLGFWGQILVSSSAGTDALNITKGTTGNLDKAKEFAEEKGLELVSSVDDLIGDDSLDAVILATPHSMHVDQVKAAAAAGKHVFCEKPLALTKAEAEEAVKACRDAGVTLAVGFNRRFHPGIAEIRRMIDEGELGEVCHVEANLSSPLGMFTPEDRWKHNPEEQPAGGMTPMGVHMVDTFIDWFGNIKNVYCQSFAKVLDTGSDDTTSVLMRMENGMSGYLGTLLVTTMYNRIVVYGTKGQAALERFDLGEFKFLPVKGDPVTKDFSGVNMQTLELEAFGKAISDGKGETVPLDEVIHGTAVLEAIVKSARDGKAADVG